MTGPGVVARLGERLALARDERLAPALGCRVPGALVGAPPRDAAGRPLLYVTLDDGPCADGSPRLLAALDAAGAQATAFLSADRARALPALATAWGARHRVGNHGAGHRSAWAAPGQALAGLAEGERVLEGLLGRAVRDVRPPYGRLTPGIVRWARGGRRIVLWSRMPGDWRPAVSAEMLAGRIVRGARPGDVLVLHDGPPAERAARALALALPRLADAGWRFPALPEMSAPEALAPAP